MLGLVIGDGILAVRAFKNRREVGGLGGLCRRRIKAARVPGN